MSSWLESILDELRALDNAATAALEPEIEASPKEHAVGVISEEARKIYVISTKSFARSCEARSALLLLRGEARLVKSFESAHLQRRAETLKEIFWMSCIHEFPELYTIRSPIGIRKGWTLVWFEREEKEQSHERPPAGMIPVFIPIGIPVRHQPPNANGDGDPDEPPDKKGPDGNPKLN